MQGSFISSFVWFCNCTYFCQGICLGPYFWPGKPYLSGLKLTLSCMILKAVGVLPKKKELYECNLIYISCICFEAKYICPSIKSSLTWEYWVLYIYLIKNKSRLEIFSFLLTKCLICLSNRSVETHHASVIQTTCFLSCLCWRINWKSI